MMIMKTYFDENFNFSKLKKNSHNEVSSLARWQHPCKLVRLCTDVAFLQMQERSSFSLR